MESEGGNGGPAPLAQRKAYRGRRTTEMNQIDESLLILPRDEGTFKSWLGPPLHASDTSADVVPPW